MEDDTVLCADCLDELRSEHAPETASTMLHACVQPHPELRCRTCDATGHP
jgi:hypothetical protein